MDFAVFGYDVLGCLILKHGISALLLVRVSCSKLCKRNQRALGSPREYNIKMLKRQQRSLIFTDKLKFFIKISFAHYRVIFDSYAIKDMLPYRFCDN